MIALVALGVPGDVIIAVILGAFMIHGLRSGPLLFQQNIAIGLCHIHGHHAEFCLPFFCGGELSIPLISRIAEVSKSI